MFDDLRKALRDSVAAFRAEVSKREPEDEVVELLSAMRRELVTTRAALKELEAGVERARTDAAREAAEAEQCERRRALAERIGDQETVRVAREFALRHRERAEVARQRLAALEAERDLRRREADEMKRRYQEADANRHALVAELRRGGTRQRIRSLADEAGVSQDSWSRMQERIEGDAAYADALEELDPSPAPPPPPADDVVEARLRELKRQMGQG